ncbi:GMC family oxidoreductase [Heliophilum fasciatum]|uniref:Choline dehydrogenase-like flavoprotein n=1 Tax=Heliophilum fasciatum TaxID=35700 RepID=A0A4R2RWW3_9FIRM|nr:GMC family oxidoreductase [Heliophilum fasciatum]MCW2276659.1 choline dehydrogenase-like flavoprotein [Heliophilum fasciatum]TCP68960.1 choline dehydrogenase-like flavoprotein [Heliophilum fasciatum]
MSATHGAPWPWLDETVDVVVVGAGATGGLVARELGRAGCKVVLLEAGPHWQVERDFVSDELHMRKTAWRAKRLTAGADPPELGHNIAGTGVGGGTIHFTAVTPRFFSSDFHIRTADGVGEDWPIAYDDLVPYYERLEKEIPVSGPKEYPWGGFKGSYPYPEREPIAVTHQLFREGCERLGIRSTVAPLAILSAPYEGRPPCINRGFCAQGCLPNSKFSTLIHHISQAVEARVELRPGCMVNSILVDDDERVEGVTFLYDGTEYRQRAAIVVLCASAIETPRLLLMSMDAGHPQGLANRSGMVGKCFMLHSGHEVIARFPVEVLPYKGTPIMATTQEFYETPKDGSRKRGFTLHSHGSRPLGFLRPVVKASGAWGANLREIARDYNFFARITMVGEVLPQVNNSVTLTGEIDASGLPVPLITFSYGDNDHKVIEAGVAMAKRILEAAGGRVEFVAPDTSHMLGGCRMGKDPATSVTDAWGRTHDHPNLFIADTSLFVTSGASNPTLTAMALAWRTVDHLIDQMRSSGS